MSNERIRCPVAIKTRSTAREPFSLGPRRADAPTTRRIVRQAPPARAVARNKD